ncbi:MAG: acyl-CoA dehydrogenase family protein [Chloroflexota bacterium]
MDFSLEYTEEQEKFAQEVREWLDKNIPEGIVHPREPQKVTVEQWQKKRELGRRLGEKGWLYPSHPNQYGGGGLDVDRNLVIRQELGKRGFSVPPYYDSGGLATAAVMACGTEEQKQRFLPPILKGQAHTWQLFTEPEAGTDEANQQTNALHSTREQDYFVVNGSKIFVGGLPTKPDQFLLLTRSDLKAPRHENLAMFLAPANSPGVTIQPLDLFPSGTFRQVLGVSADPAPGIKHSVFFDDVKIHKSYLIGGEKDGWKVATAALLLEHGEGTEGIPRNMVAAKFIEQCRSNPNIAKRLKENPRLLDIVVDVFITTQVERLFNMRNAWLTSSHKRAAYTGPQISVYTKMFGAKLAQSMAEVLGPYALTSDEQRGLEDSIFEVGERSGICLAPAGTPEALRIIISRALRLGISETK